MSKPNEPVAVVEFLKSRYDEEAESDDLRLIREAVLKRRVLSLAVTYDEPGLWEAVHVMALAYESHHNFHAPWRRAAGLVADWRAES